MRIYTKNKVAPTLVCNDCLQGTSDSYMLDDKTWKAIGGLKNDHFCFSCLFKRLKKVGRSGLTAQDLVMFPVNNGLRSLIDVTNPKDMITLEKIPSYMRDVYAVSPEVMQKVQNNCC